MEKIEILDGLFLSSEFCIWYEPKETIIISDLHLGYEASLRDEGVSLPRFQKEEILDRLSNIFDKFEPRSLIVNGDFKHSFGENRDEEFYAVMDVIDHIEDHCSLGIVRGNHDNFLKTITENKGVPLYEEPLHLDNFIITHGQGDIVDEIKEEDLIILGHEHPSLKIRDEMGSVLNLPCFLYHPHNNILILPAFSPLAQGRDVINNEVFISDSLSDTGTNLNDFQVFAISDTGLMDFQTVQEIKMAYPDMS